MTSWLQDEPLETRLLSVLSGGAYVLTSVTFDEEGEGEG